MEDILDIQPGCVIRLPDLIRTVIALLPDNQVLTDVGEVRPVTEVHIIRDELIEEIIISPGAVIALNKFQMASPYFEQFQVRDGLLLLSGHYGKLTFIAAIDHPRRKVYTKDGEIVPLNSPSVFKTGWRTDTKDLLTHQGLAVLWSLY